MNEKDAISLFETLGDETTLKIYTAIQQDPQTPSELREVTDTSLQNTHYHLNKLEDAGLVEPVDTWVSKRGKDMDVYGPTNSPLILSFAAEERTSRIRSRIKNALSILGVISFFSLLVEYAVAVFAEPASDWQQVGAGGYGEQRSLTELFFQYPGLCVFVVGLLVVLAYVAFVSSRR
ncbi:ArsR/SmtB family transcription factor [Halobacterium jilantaiense]|nr:winged helix-turn-helix domain-containing protein [Halobacterium jilantaiense]